MVKVRSAREMSEMFSSVQSIGVAFFVGIPFRNVWVYNFSSTGFSCLSVLTSTRCWYFLRINLAPTWICSEQDLKFWNFLKILKFFLELTWHAPEYALNNTVSKSISCSGKTVQDARVDTVSGYWRDMRNYIPGISVIEFWKEGADLNSHGSWFSWWLPIWASPYTGSVYIQIILS